MLNGQENSHGAKFWVVPSGYEWIGKGNVKLSTGECLKDLKKKLNEIEISVSQLLSAHNSWAYPNCIRETGLDSTLLVSVMRRSVCKVCLKVIKENEGVKECSEARCCAYVHASCLAGSAWRDGVCDWCGMLD